MPGPEQHVRDVIVSFFWRCFPMEPDERQARGLQDDADVLRCTPADLGSDAIAFADALHSAFALPDDVDLHHATVGEAVERVLVHWNRKSFEPEALGFAAREETSLAADDDEDVDGEMGDSDE